MEEQDDEKNGSKDKIVNMEDLGRLVPKTANFENRMKLKRSWRSTGNGALGPSAIKYACKNVAAFLLPNQLGPKEFVASTPTTTSSVMDPKLAQTLTAERTGSSSFTRISSISDPIIPFQMDLPGLFGDLSTGPNQLINDDRRKDINWAWITLNVLGNVRLETAGDLLWSCCLKPGEPDDSKLCLLQFYSFSPATFEFKIVSSYTIAARILKWEVLEYQDPLTHQTFKFFILLNQAKQLLAYDLDKRTMTADLQLMEDDPPDDDESDSDDETGPRPPPKTYFIGFEICHQTQQLLMLKTDRYGNLHTIVIFSFPPKWTSVDILHLGHLRMQFFLDNGYCFIARDSMSIAAPSWHTLYAQAYSQPYLLGRSADPRNDSPCPDFLTVRKILTIDKIPPTATIITPKLQRPRFGMLNLTPPLLHTKINDDIHFYRLDLSSTPTTSSTAWDKKMGKSRFEETSPVYECLGVAFGMDDYRTNIVEFPDKSPRFLFTNPKLSNHVVVTFVNDPKTGKIQGIKSCPFAYDDDKVSDRLITRENDGADIHSQSNSNLSILPKHFILGMDYCSSLNMLAVLFGIGNCFVVKMYEPDTLQLLHTMPIVQRVQTVHLNSDRVISPSIVFQPEFLLVEIFLVDHFGSVLRELFVGRLFVEDFRSKK